MNTAERALAIARTAEGFDHLLGKTTVEDLMAWVEVELGDRGILDGWVRRGAGYTKAKAPCAILHVVSGNTPHAALQSLVGGLLLGARNYVKLPTGGLPEVGKFVARLPEELRKLVVTSEVLDEEWFWKADAVIVYGSDETIATLRARVPAGKVFVGHGHKVSLGVVWEDERFKSCAGAARDVSLFDQQGCLSAHAFYVREVRPGFAREYAEHLAKEMERFNEEHPRGEISLEERAVISDLRAAYKFRAAGDLGVAIWEGGGDMDWTVIYEEDVWFPASCMNRVVFVKPLPENLADGIGPVAHYVGAVGLWPCTMEVVKHFETLEASRFCEIGQMQAPLWSWHNGGVARLASLVKWIDFETKEELTT